MTEILDLNYNNHVTLLGTAHFTRRSLLEAYDAVKKLKPSDLAIELDIQRFQHLNKRCASCPQHENCAGRCEFVGAIDALGNIDANIWLIDMSEREIAERIQRFLPYSQLWRLSLISHPFWNLDGVDDEVELWEKGYKEEVLNRHTRRLEVLRTKAPYVWQVLIDERNALMAARLAWIVTQKLSKDESVRVLTLTGAAHVDGIKELLSSPLQIGDELQRFGLRFTVPMLIRRVGVN